MSKKLKLPVIIGPKIGDTQLVSGAMPAIILVSNYKIDYRDGLNKNGYQRNATTSRVRQLSKDIIEKKVEIPTPVLINFRDAKLDILDFEPTKNGKINLFDNDLSFYDKSANLILDFDSEDKLIKDHKFQLIDGQHRTLALEQALKQEGTEWLQSKLINFTAFIGANFDQELEQFYIINSNSKPVRSDLALELLKHQADRSSIFMDALRAKDQDWKVRGQSLLDEITKHSTLWDSIVVRPNMKPKSDVKVPSSSFVISLKSLMTDSDFRQTELTQQARIFISFWQSIEQIIPEAFPTITKTGKDTYTPKDFAILKGIGVSVMNEYLTYLLPHIRKAGLDMTKAASYTEFLRDTFSSIEEYNSEGSLVSDKEFWLVASKGGAVGSFSSGAGKKALVHKLTSSLPNL